MIFCRENRDGEFLDLKMSAGNQGGTKSVFSCNALNLQSSAVQSSAVQSFQQVLFIKKYLSQLASPSFSLGALFWARLVLIQILEIDRYF